MKTILFQGDSITDARRSREQDNFTMGSGYALLVKGELGYDNIGEYEFINRGISGNRVVDLYARIKSDILNLSPDVMSILIGVNDVWHEIQQQNGVDAEKFFKIYSMLIDEVLEELPDLKIIIMEPFVLKGSATEENWETFRKEVEKRAEKAKAISEKYNFAFVPLQKQFDELSKNTTTDYWLFDGVHPTAIGHELIKREWIKAFNTIKIGG